MSFKTSSFHRLMNCRYLILYFFCFHIRKVIVGAEFTLCGSLHGSINKSRHYIGSGRCSLEVSVNPTGLEIKANLIDNGPSIYTEDIIATAPNAPSEFCITWKEHFGQLFLTHGDVVKSYSTTVDCERKCCQNFVLTNNTSNIDSSLLSDIIYINGTDFSPVHIENASYSEFTGSEAVCESSSSDCIKQKNKLTQLAARVDLKRNDARYAMLLINSILENCNQSISDSLESNLTKMMLNIQFSKDNEIFVTPNVKAAVISNWVGNAVFDVVANFSWVGADGMTMFAAVKVILEDQIFLLHPAPPRKAVAIHFKNKTSIQGQEKIPVSPSVTVQMGNSITDDLSIPLTVTFEEWAFKSNPIQCQSKTSEQDVFDQDGCNVINNEGRIICSCDLLGYSFNLTLESKGFQYGFTGPFKITTQSNYSNNVNVTPPTSGSPCETSLESTTSVSSSSDPNKSCNYLFEQWRKNNSEQCLDAIKTANTFMQKCHNQIPDIASISSILENKLMSGDCEEETQVGETGNIIFYIRNINPESFTGIQFSNSDTVNISTSDLQVEIKLPPTLLDNVNIIGNNSNTTALRIMFLIFKNTTLFQDQNKSMILNYVTGIRVGTISIDNLTDPVIIAFNKSSSRKAILKCVFWDEGKNGNTTIRHWNESGCTTENTDHQTICRCNHLTFFAVLMQLNRNQSLDKKTLISLTYITQIGCGLSAIFTTITLIIHYILRERQKEFSIQIHMNLSAALFLLNVIFLINVWLNSVRIDSFCKVMAVLLHYSLLCSFTWMGIEAFHLYIMLVKVFNTYIKWYMLKLRLVGWGIPAAMLSIIVGINIDFYGQHVIPVNGNYSSTNYNSINMCWITNDIVFYVTIIAYFVLVFLGNTTMMIVVCIKIIRLKGDDKKNIFTILGLTCLLGITYGIAFFSYGSLNVPALYLFCILNPLQGFFIFLWYCMLIRSSFNTAGKNSKTSKSTTD